MKLASGVIEVKFTLGEANEYNEMVMRDQAKAVICKEHEFDDNGEKKKYVTYSCPVCKVWVHEDANFCHHCGQRLDTENIALGGDE